MKEDVVFVNLREETLQFLTGYLKYKGYDDNATGYIINNDYLTIITKTYHYCFNFMDYLTWLKFV
jgi:hypothetical protein